MHSHRIHTNVAGGVGGCGEGLGSLGEPWTLDPRGTASTHWPGGVGGGIWGMGLSGQLFLPERTEEQGSAYLTI